MKEFILLIHGDSYHDESPQALEEHMQKYVEWMKDLKNRNLFVKGNRLENDSRVVRPKTIIGDGPYVEPKEIIGGYIILRANNLGEAEELVLTCPLSNEFFITVKPLMPDPSEFI
ncbi:hypothetical protein J0X14_04410 [Muricauda sp. CAU 1633]|uniref:YciI family protein n=1 Tax=Allomuricauda sp. CAU 1633 TaxID=2816036 RepID=UPI001A8C1528|nr:YciI family protein [Muricauda sp. CAU 1633]MBO0321531.1 hypothetical protein [Muricauda sp. CAU 1633]